MAEPAYTAYMDDTGQAADDAQRFCGMPSLMRLLYCLVNLADLS